MGPVKKPDCALALAAERRPLKTACGVLGVAHSGSAVNRLSRESYGCMLRKGDLPFKRIAIGTIAPLMKLGDATAPYAKWFEQPGPQRGLNLEFKPPRDMIPDPESNRQRLRFALRR